jgi:hypothetical protein
MSLEAAVGWFHVKDGRGAVGGKRLERGDHRANLGVGGGAPPPFAFVRHVAAFLADLRGEDADVFAEQTSRNFFSLVRDASAA